MICIGTCSWTEKTLMKSGAFYPRGVRTAELRGLSTKKILTANLTKVLNIMNQSGIRITNKVRCFVQKVYDKEKVHN